ncbi:MAG: hypothetical protein ABIG30_02450 [Candidatus Aenigmatarchaeota archaeon]
MKAITPVISVILLLLITIAIIGIAFGWFIGIFGTTTTDVGDDITHTVDRMQKTSRIDSAVCTDTTGDTLVTKGTLKIWVKATGSADLKAKEVAVYFNNAKKGENTADIPSGSVGEIVITGTENWCAAGTLEIKDPAGVGDTKILS